MTSRVRLQVMPNILWMSNVSVGTSGALCSFSTFSSPLQLGQPSAIVDSLRVPISSSQSNSNLNSSLSFGIPTEPQPLFMHTVSLCQIISRIKFYFYLGFGHSDPQSQLDKLTMLQGELDQWHHALPLQFRISIGHQPEREVLEVNMLYHVAIILLYRPL